MRSPSSEVSPLWATRRRPDRPTLGPRIAETARLLGKPFMPHQRLVADVGGELDPDTGLPAYREVVVSMPRQSGKTIIVLAWEVDRCVMWEGRQRVVYTAQTGWDAREKLLDDHAPLVQKSALRSLLKPMRSGDHGVLRGSGHEAIVFRDGSKIAKNASSEASGHGPTIDLGVIDEAWHDTDDRREQAMIPAMATIDSAQLLVPSTAGTSKSVYFRRKVEAGRHAAEADSGSGIAYFEWGVPKDDAVDPFDPAVWRRFMPALGHTISEQAVAHAAQTMDEDEFLRAFCNQWRESEHARVVPAELWDAVQDPAAQPDDPLTFGVDVLPDRSAGAIAAAGGGAVELIEHGEGTGWIAGTDAEPGRAVELVRNWGGVVVVDGNGPAASIGEDLQRMGVEVEFLSTPEVAAACARMYDAIADGTVKVRPSEPVDAAVAGLAKRSLGDRFMWSRSASDADVTPLFAETLAFSVEADAAPQVW